MTASSLPLTPSLTLPLASLAAGVVLDVEPLAAVDVAADAGWDAVGLWFTPERWVGDYAERVAARLAERQIVALDIEPVIMGRGDDHGHRLIDAGAIVGARFVLVASGPASVDDVTARLAELAEYASAAAPQVTLCLEFLPIFSVGSFGAAIDVVRRVDCPNVGVLVDSLHLARSGQSPADLVAEIDLVPYVQLADAPASAAETGAVGLREEALHGRLLPGHGNLPLDDFLTVTAGRPISVELRSRDLNRAYPDATQRAVVVRQATQRALERHRCNATSPA